MMVLFRSSLRRLSARPFPVPAAVIASPSNNAPGCVSSLSSSSSAAAVGGAMEGSLFDPTPEHAALREMVRGFPTSEVDPQALEYNREEKFNMPLFKRLGELDLLGITVPEKFGGAGMDATAACIAHEEISAADPAFCLSYLAHSMLF